MSFPHKSEGTIRRQLVFFLLEIGVLDTDAVAMYLVNSGLKSGSLEEVQADIINYFVRAQ